MREDTSHEGKVSDTKVRSVEPVGQTVVDRVLQIEEEMAATHTAKGSLLLKVGIPAIVVMTVLVAASFLLPMYPSERFRLLALTALIAGPSVAVVVLLGRGRSDRRRLQEEMEMLLSDPRPEGIEGETESPERD